MLVALERSARAFCKWLALIGLLGLVALAGITIADVMMRWLFASPIDGVSDIYRLLIAVVVASFFPASFAERGHISIHFLSAVLPRAGRRGLTVLAALVTLGFTIVLGWQFILYCLEVYAAGETTWLLGLSVTPWWIIATALLLLCIPIQLIVVLSEATGTSEATHHSGHAVDSDQSASDGGQGS